jgi:hypothetical protein
MQYRRYPSLILKQPLLLFIDVRQLGQRVSRHLALDLVLNLRQLRELDYVASDVFGILDELALGLQPEHLVSEGVRLHRAVGDQVVDLQGLSLDALRELLAHVRQVHLRQQTQRGLRGQTHEAVLFKGLRVLEWIHDSHELADVLRGVVQGDAGVRGV